MPSFKKLLVIRPRFLGDIIISTGMAEIIHQNNPDAEVWYLTEANYADVLENHPRIAGVLRFDARRKNNPLYLLKFQMEIRKKKFDVVFDLFCNPRTARMSFLSGAPVRVGFKMRGRSWAYTVIAKPASEPFPSGRRPATEAYLDQLKAIGFSNREPYKPSLYVTEDEKAHVQKIFSRANIKPGEKVAVLSPGAAWPAKRWPLDRFVELGFWLKSAGVRPLYLFGPRENELVKDFEGRMDKDWILIHQDSPKPRGLMAFVEAADILVSNDTGPMHVGPAVGTPTFGIFGPENPETWFPYPKPHEMDFFEIGCSNCGLNYCPMMACMDHLDTKTVSQRVLSLLGKKSPRV